MVEFMDGFGDAGSIVGEGLFFGFEAEAFVLVTSMLQKKKGLKSITRK